MKIVTLVGVDDVIIQSNLVSIFLGVSDLQGVKISIFLLTLLVVITTLLRSRASTVFVLWADVYIEGDLHVHVFLI